MDQTTTILSFWFGPKPYNAKRLAERMQFWFGAAESREFLLVKDDEIRQRFAPLMARAAEGALEHWAASPRRRLALILLLDQFPRNVFRGKAQAYAADARAAELTLSGMQNAADAPLQPIERVFFYMPLQHAEELVLQEESVTAFRRLLAEAPAVGKEHFEATLRFAILHREIIRRFGRFPHRNRALGRTSSKVELEYLRGGGPRFGQNA